MVNGNGSIEGKNKNKRGTRTVVLWLCPWVVGSVETTRVRWVERPSPESGCPGVLLGRKGGKGHTKRTKLELADWVNCEDVHTQGGYLFTSFQGTNGPFRTSFTVKTVSSHTSCSSFIQSFKLAAHHQSQLVDHHHYR